MVVDIGELYTWLIHHPDYVVYNLYRKGVKVSMRVINRKWANNGSVVLDGRVAEKEGIDYVRRAVEFMHTKGLDLEINRGYLVITYLR